MSRTSGGTSGFASSCAAHLLAARSARSASANRIDRSRSAMTAPTRPGDQADERAVGRRDRRGLLLLLQVGRRARRRRRPRGSSRVRRADERQRRQHADEQTAEQRGLVPVVMSGPEPDDRARSRSPRRRLVVVLAPEVRDELLALHVAQRVLQLHQLDEQVVLRIQTRRVHRALEVERQPLLDARTCPRASPGRGTARRRARSAPPGCCRGRGS